MIIIDEDKYNLLKKHLRDDNTFTDNEIDAMMSVYSTEKKVRSELNGVADKILEELDVAINEYLHQIKNII